MLEMKRIDKLLFFDNFHDYMFYDSFMNDDNYDNNNKNKSFVKTRSNKSIDKKDIKQSSTTNTKNKTIITSNDIRVQRNKEAFKLLNEKNVFEYHINLDIQIVLCNMQSIIVKGKRIIMILMMIITILIMMIMIMMKIIITILMMLIMIILL